MHDPISLGILKCAAQAGDSQAQYQLAERYRCGTGVEVDFVLARQWLLRAAEQGEPNAQNDLASMLLNGLGGPKDVEIATIWYHRAARAGQATAQFNLALRYLHGDGVEADPAVAAMWLRSAAEQGHVEATCQLGTLFCFGRGTEQSYSEAGWLHVRAAKGGDLVAYGNLCDYHQEIAALALAGDLRSALVMAEIHAGGFGVDRDRVEGLAWALLVGSAALPFQDDEEIEREQHLVLLTTLQAELTSGQQAESAWRCELLASQLAEGRTRKESAP